MLDIFNTFATDENAELKGSWQKIGQGDFLIARANNRNYIKALQSKFAANQAALDAGDEAAEKLSDSIMVDLIAETILLGWGEVTYQGALLPYSLENAKKVLTHKDFRAEVMKLANSIDGYRLKVEADQVKN